MTSRRAGRGGFLLSLYAGRALLSILVLILGVSPSSARPLADPSIRRNATAILSRSVDGPGVYRSWVVVLAPGVDMAAHLMWLAGASRAFRSI